jgi:polar amino acid transport system substrate-binding protein
MLIGQRLYFRRFNPLAVVVIAIIVALSALSPASAAAKKLKLCYTTWGQYGGDDLPAKGFMPDLVTRVLEHAGYEVSIDIIPWPRCIIMTKKRKYDMVASGWRGKNFDPYFEYLNITVRNDISFVVRKDSDFTSSEIENFEGKSVAYVRETGGMDPILQNKKIEFVEVSEMNTMIPMLHGGRMDAVITDPESFFVAAAARNPPLDDGFRTLEPPVFNNFNSPLVPKGHPDLEELREKFDRSFKILIKEGLYPDLIRIHGQDFVDRVPLHAR